MNESIEIKEIDEKSKYLPEVIELGDANRQTLGHLSYETFYEYALKGQIIVALDSHGNLMGYVLYRKVRKTNSIVLGQLCIKPSFRRRGIAKKLVNYLSQNNQKTYGIKLKCRRDYGLGPMWEKLGFQAVNEKVGRSKKGKLLTVWWLDHDRPTLFSSHAAQKLDSNLCAIVDIEVFLELKNEGKKANDLQEDWLEGDLEVCVTNEIFNAINALEDDNNRKQQRLFAETFTKLPCKYQDFDKFLKILNNFILENNFQINDLASRQLARAIASDCPVFVTRDRQILDLSDRLYEKFQLEIVTPENLIANLDDLNNKNEYQPARLAGSNQLKILPLRRNQIESISQHFLAAEKGETLEQLKRKLRQWSVNSEHFQCEVVVEGENRPLALIAYNKKKNHELEIPLLRVVGGSLEGTLARYLLFRVISDSAQTNRYFTRICEPYLKDSLIRAIQEDAFFRIGRDYLKANLDVAETASQLSKRLADLAKLEPDYRFCLQIAATLNTEEATKNMQTTADLERCLWPAKIVDAELLTLVIPIQPRWAKDLFDEGLANQWLFGSKTEIALKRELVYYRSKRGNGGLKPGAIGRILWYVSYDRHSSSGETKA
ncbi:MAG: GNAT family N-acetyltransferase, partial [Okeania sp. SIO2H7]|nr:GNAT family N-acetyltransferase [Okeania sp. SIO2H7]